MKALASLNGNKKRKTTLKIYSTRIQRNQQVKQRRRMEYAESKKMEASTPLIFVIGYFIVSFIYFNRAEWERKGEELLLYLDWI